MYHHGTNCLQLQVVHILKNWSTFKIGRFIHRQDTHWKYHLASWRFTSSLFPWKSNNAFLFIVVHVDVLVYNIECSVLPLKCKHGFPFHSCRTTNYLVLLLSIIVVKYLWAFVYIYNFKAFMALQYIYVRGLEL